MYKKVLVPLDGSELAECALSHAQNMANDGFAGEVTILNVYWANTPFIGEADTSIGFDIEALREELLIDSQKYLTDVKSRLGPEGIKVKTESLEGIRPAATIADYAQKNSIDLIIIATHGYTGLKKLMFGSVALEVMHNSYAPVLLIRPESCRT